MSIKLKTYICCISRHFLEYSCYSTVCGCLSILHRPRARHEALSHSRERGIPVMSPRQSKKHICRPGAPHSGMELSHVQGHVRSKKDPQDIYYTASLCLQSPLLISITYSRYLGLNLTTCTTVLLCT